MQASTYLSLSLLFLLSEGLIDVRNGGFSIEKKPHSLNKKTESNNNKIEIKTHGLKQS